MNEATGPETAGAQRIDRWLWFARFFKSRALATKWVESGKVRLSRAGRTDIVRKPALAVRSGDVLTFTIGQRVIVVEIRDPGHRRGPAPEAQALYNDLSPPPPREEAGPTSSGPRPTKKDRRDMDRLRGGDQND